MSNPSIYTVGWICAITTEYVAAQAFLDEEHSGPEYVSSNDNNDYTLGKIGKHNVVIAVLPHGEYGTASAAAVARDMLHSFVNIRVGLMVGIGGGAPSKNHDIRLGDIVVSANGHNHGGVYQYDFGKAIQEQQFITTRFLNQPSKVVRTAVSGLIAQYERKGHQLEAAINKALVDNPRLRKKYRRPSNETDQLHVSTVIHPSDTEESCAASCSKTPHQLVIRRERGEDEDDPAIHYGLIASANRLMKDAVVRDKLAQEHGVLCFEMEAAGLMNDFPCLVIRGICDYSDTHKNKEWQGYAAMVAAAYAKDLLNRIAPNQVEAERRLSDALAGLKNIADDHRNVAHEHKKIAQDEAKRQSSNRENECLQLFRLTGSDKDTTYESYKAQVEARVEGTCTWVLNHCNFSIWLAQDSGPLLISADPGCGKSVLAKYLIDDVLCKDSTICYYFFRDQDQNTVRQLLCAVLHQLFCKFPALIKHAMGAFKKNGNKLINSTDSLWSILSNVLQEPEAGKVILVMDALDECLNPELNKLLCGLGSQYRDLTESGTKVKYIFTTRPYEQILLGFKRNFNDASTIRIPGEEESDTISQEVNLVIQYRVGRLAGDMGLKDELKEILTQELLEVSHRTYLWVHLIFNFLQTKRFKKTKDGITSAARTLPKSVNAAYNQILSRSDDESMVRKALTIILAAERPLTLDEINVAMGINPETETFEGLDLECNKDFADSLRNCCGLFVSVYHGTVHFLHQTAREFLLTESGPDAAGRSNLKWEKFITLRQARHELAEISLRFFSLFKGRTIPIVDPALSQSWHERRDLWEQRMEWRFGAGEIAQEKLFYDLPYAVYAFATYAASFLRSQFLQPENCVTQSPSPELASKHFDPTSEPFQVWKYLLMDPEIDGFTSTLQMTSRLGLSTVVAFLLQGNVDIELRDTTRRLTPLLWAVECGHFEVVKLLVEGGADVNAQTGHESVLGVAVRRSDKTTVKFLLENRAKAKVEFSERLVEVASGKRKFDGMSEFLEMMLDAGADANTHVGTLYSALGLAVSSGHNELAELLLKKGADVDQQGGEYGCALGSAAHAGHEESVELLLKRGAEINAQAGDFGTALGAAAYQGHIGVVRLLSTRGADITKQGGKYGCALGSAVHSGHEKLVQLLLAKYSDANMPSWRYDCSLRVAATLGRDRADIAEMLLDAGADADMLVGESFALEAAAYHGNPNVVDLLLARGADVNKQGGKYGCLLEAAVSCPQSKEKVIEIIKRLVHCEVDIDAPCGNFGTVLGRAASIRGNEAVVELLIHLKADVHIKKGNFTNAVTAAAYGGDEETVRALLREDADIHAQGKFFPNALAAAAYADQHHMVEFLFDRGADIHQQGGLYFDAIGCAVRGNNGKTVQWLLEKGIEATISKSGGWSPLLLASDQGSYSIVKRLLDHGVAQLPDDEGWTPLMRASYRGHTKTIKLLLDREADMAAVNKFGQTSLYIASSQGHIEVVRLLLDKKVDPNSSNRRGWTPLRAAIRNGHYEIATLLRQNNAEEVVASFF